ncbi:oligosaccharide flippase family protein, partial [Chromobacterium violaceum]|uniref:oligosaccharide flippase family protein n=1 Tax=Chromobacterium violaceum TaxID=536 RepID=UPI00385A090C
MKAFGPIAKTKLSQSIVMAGIQLAGAPLGPSALVVGQIAGQGSGSLSLFIRVLRDRLPLLAGIRVSDVLAVARRYKQCPVFSTWGALFNTACAQLPSVMFAVFFSPAAAGMYALENRVLSMPMQLLGQSIGQVFFSDAAQAHREGRLGALVAGIHGRLAHIGMPP